MQKDPPSWRLLLGLLGLQRRKMMIIYHLMMRETASGGGGGITLFVFNLFGHHQESLLNVGWALRGSLDERYSQFICKALASPFLNNSLALHITLGAHQQFTNLMVQSMCRSAKSLVFVWGGGTCCVRTLSCPYLSISWNHPRTWLKEASSVIS